MTLYYTKEDYTTLRNVMQHYTTLYKAIRAILYNVNYTRQYNTIRHYAIIYKTIRHYTTAIQRYTKLYNTIYKGYTKLYDTIQRYTTLYTTLYNVVQDYMTLCKTIHIGVRDGGAGGAAAPPKRLQSRKVGQMFNISRAKSGKLKSQKAKKNPVCWANKGSRAIFASQSGNIGLL
jgi:hypothetical protein